MHVGSARQSGGVAGVARGDAGHHQEDITIPNIYPRDKINSKCMK